MQRPGGRALARGRDFRWLRWEPGRLWTSLLGPRGEPIALVLLSIGVGVIGGLGAVAFRWLIRSFTELFTRMTSAGGPGTAGSLLSVTAPVIGLLVVGAIARYVAPEVKGDGIPQIFEALSLRGGRIRPRVAGLGIVSPAITIGSGGSVGQEGPIALIGAAFGSVVGRLLRLPGKYTAVLLACGSAAGIAANFRAPIAGAFFGLEVVLGSYAMGAVVPVLIAALTGVSTFETLVGKEMVLAIPPYSMVDPVQLLPVLVLGVLAGLVGLAYSRGLQFVEDVAERRRVSFAVRAAMGGVLVGLIGLAFPQVLRVGYDTMGRAASGQLTLSTMALLLVAKYVATLTTIGSGGSGGAFAPSLYLGTMLGGVFGDLLQWWFPGAYPRGTPYAMVGMGAVFAASAQAPLTAIAIILEMTGGWGMTLGVMGACAISYFVHGTLSRDSMYTLRLSRRGIVIVRGAEVRPTERITVSAAMAPVEGIVPEDTPLEEAYRRLTHDGHDPLLVVDCGGLLVGVLSLTDLRSLPVSVSRDAPIASVAKSSVVTVFPDETLESAMRRFAVYDFAMLPVVERADPRRVVGRLRRSDVLRAYNSFTLHNLETSVRIDFLREARADQGAFREVVIPEGSPLAGSPLGSVALPPECVLVSVRRGDHVLVPHGSTVIAAGDRILFFAVPAARADELATWLNSPPALGNGLRIPAPPAATG